MTEQFNTHIQVNVKKYRESIYVNDEHKIYVLRKNKKVNKNALQKLIDEGYKSIDEAFDNEIVLINDISTNWHSYEFKLDWLKDLSSKATH